MVGLLLIGFTTLAVAVQLLTRSWVGYLLPAGYVAGAWAALRVQVRAVELAEDHILISTFFRQYPIPRAHITSVLAGPEGAVIYVLNGARYDVTPEDVEPEAFARAMDQWWRRDVPTASAIL